MKIAIVILNWNGAELLQKFLPSVIENSLQTEIFVVDNASTDASLGILKKQFPTIKIVENQENGGFAKGYNQGLKKIKADVYCLLNSDVKVSPNWLLPVVEIFQNEPSVAVVQPKIRDYRRPAFFEYAGAAGGFLDAFGYPFCRGRIFDTLEEDKGQYDDKCDIFWASGACMFIRSEIFWEMNGFDENFFAHQEEIDLCWRIQKIGKQIVFEPKSVVYHLGGGTLLPESPFKVYLNFRNNLFLLLKNLPKNKLFYILFFRMVLDGVAGVRFFVQGKFSLVWAILKAHFHFYRKIMYFYKKREPERLKINYAKEISVVYSYFVQREKYFSDRL